MENKLYDARKNNCTISNNMDYEKCMNFYLSKDNSELKEYLQSKKSNNEITDEEVEFWEDAMNLDIVQGICRTAIVEYHEEDRKKDPPKIKAVRRIFRMQEDVAEVEKVNDPNEQLKRAFGAIYTIGYALKEIIKQKVQNRDINLMEIVDNIDFDEIAEKENNLLNKMKNFSNRIKTMNQNQNGNLFVAYYKSKFFGKLASTLVEYDEEQMQDYTKQYLSEKKGKLEESKLVSGKPCMSMYSDTTLSEIRESKSDISESLKSEKNKDDVFKQ